MLVTAAAAVAGVGGRTIFCGAAAGGAAVDAANQIRGLLKFCAAALWAGGRGIKTGQQHFEIAAALLALVTENRHLNSGSLALEQKETGVPCCEITYCQ